MTTFPESHRDLLELPVAALATVAEDGSPEVTAIWFLYDEGTLRLSLSEARQKVKNLERNPSCNLFLIDTANPYRYLEVRASAEIEPDVDYAFADKLGKKYGGADLRTRDQPGEQRMVVTLKPTKVRAVTVG